MTALVLISVIFVSVGSFAEDLGGYCEAKSNQVSDCSASKSNMDASMMIPPTWVRNLHSFEAAKLPSDESNCKTVEAVIENVSLHCNYAETIRSDLKRFNSIRFEDLEKARKSDRHAVTYKLVHGRLFRSRDCLFPSRCEGVDHFLKTLKKNLSDFEIVVNTHDWPFINRHFYPEAVPLFSFSKTSDYFDIYFPAWTFWAGGPAIQHYPSGLGRWDLMREKLKISFSQWPWRAKKDVAFFRGSRTSAERDNLVKLSVNRPDLVDAMYTKNQAWKSAKDTLGMDPASEVLLEDHCRYKYLFNFRGVAASFRLKHLFMCGSLVFHVGDEWKEFFYDALRPWYHYIPVGSDATEAELEDLIDFVGKHQDISRKIADNGREFIMNHLRMKDVENYWLALLRSYTKLLRFQVTEPKSSENFIELL